MQSALSKVPGVISYDVLLADSKAIVKLEEGKVTTAQLTEAIKQVGFGAEAATN